MIRYRILGDIVKVNGFALAQNGQCPADGAVVGDILLRQGARFIHALPVHLGVIEVKVFPGQIGRGFAQLTSLHIFFRGVAFHAILVDGKLGRRHRPFLSLAQILIRGTARRPPAARRQRSRGEQPHQHSQRKDHCQQSPFHGIFLLAQTWIWHTAAVCKNRCFSYGASIPSIMPLSGLRRLPGQALKRPRQRNSTVHNSSPPL